MQLAFFGLTNLSASGDTRNTGPVLRPRRRRLARLAASETAYGRCLR